MTGSVLLRRFSIWLRITRCRQLIRQDRGSALVGYVLVAILVIFIVAGLLQLALTLHIRNLVLDATSQGARYAALDTSTLEDGIQRTREVITADLGEVLPVEITAKNLFLSTTHRNLVEVRVTTALPIFGPFGLPRTMTVTAHALREPHYDP